MNTIYKINATIESYAGSKLPDIIDQCKEILNGYSQDSYIKFKHNGIEIEVKSFDDKDLIIQKYLKELDIN